MVVQLIPEIAVYACVFCATSDPGQKAFLSVSFDKNEAAMSHATHPLVMLHR